MKKECTEIDLLRGKNSYIYCKELPRVSNIIKIGQRQGSGMSEFSPVVD